MAVRKLLSVMLVFALALVFPTAVSAEETETGARAYVLYCVENHSIILSKNETERMRPASTTKLMTTLLTLEEAAKNDRIITFTQEMTAEGSSMYLEVGEQLRLSDLATGMMMCSGNDAANAAAISVGGSAEGFARLMNARAKQLGMAHTHFVTPSGLDDDEHYTTAYDLALLMAGGLRNRAFADLTFQKSKSVRFVKPADKLVTYNNHNRLLSLCEGCIGGKTGYTDAAGRCLVSAARRDGITLICVTLDDRDDWNDHIALYDSGFSTLERVQSGGTRLNLACVGGERQTLTVKAARDACAVVAKGKAEDVSQTVYLDPFAYAPVCTGDVLGRIDYALDGKVLDSVKLVAAEDVAAKKTTKSFIQKIKEFLTYG